MELFFLLFWNTGTLWFVRSCCLHQNCVSITRRSKVLKRKFFNLQSKDRDLYYIILFSFFSLTFFSLIFLLFSLSFFLLGHTTHTTNTLHTQHTTHTTHTLHTLHYTFTHYTTHSHTTHTHSTQNTCSISITVIYV